MKYTRHLMGTLAAAVTLLGVSNAKARDQVVAAYWGKLWSASNSCILQKDTQVYASNFQGCTSPYQWNRWEIPIEGGPGTLINVQANGYTDPTLYTIHGRVICFDVDGGLTYAPGWTNLSGNFGQGHGATGKLVTNMYVPASSECHAEFELYSDITASFNNQRLSSIRFW
jgi:hypothetical protein